MWLDWFFRFSYKPRGIYIIFTKGSSVHIRQKMDDLNIGDTTHSLLNV